MAYRSNSFAPGHIYHIYHRGLNKQKIFLDDKDRQRFLNMLTYSNSPERHLSYSIAAKIKRQEKKWPIPPEESKGYTNLLCYCLMDNHLHLLLQENSESGISRHLQRTFNGFAKYFNARHKRTGGLFTGRFRAVPIDGDEQFLHITRYIHLNPYAAGITEKPESYQWSSLREYVTPNRGICHTTLLKSMIKPKEYLAFVYDYGSYARELANVKHLLLEE